MPYTLAPCSVTAIKLRSDHAVVRIRRSLSYSYASTSGNLRLAGACKLTSRPAHTCLPSPPREPSQGAAHTWPRSSAAGPALSAPTPAVSETLCTPRKGTLIYARTLALHRISTAQNSTCKSTKIGLACPVGRATQCTGQGQTGQRTVLRLPG